MLLKIGFLFVFTLTQLSGAHCECIIKAGTEFTKGYECHAAGNNGFLSFQEDGNFVIYDSNSKPIWAVGPGADHRARFQWEGNFVITSNNGDTVCYTSETYGRGRVMKFQDDRNLVIYDEYGKAIWSSNTQVSSSCLLGGSQILMADGISTKSIESLRPGDRILDHTLTERKVEALSYEFLQNQRLYGFGNISFFTETHLLAGPGENGTVSHYVANKDLLLALNPLMEFLNPAKIKENESFPIFTFANGSVVTKKANLHIDSQPRAPDTKVYFLQVDGPHGTYFANGYACRHELPPMEGHWTNTMDILFTVFGLREFRAIGNIDYSYDKLMAFNQTVGKLSSAVFSSLKTLRNFTGRSENCGDYDYKNEVSAKEEILKEIFNSPSFSAVAVGVYGAVAKTISLRLDSGIGSCQEIKNAQSLIVGEIMEAYTNTPVYELVYG